MLSTVRDISTSPSSRISYSSYGNQIGLATGHVQEYYHDKFVAKRMEIGAVIGAAPRDTVRRERPSAGDLIVLLGGRTGRDGCGGATGSSKEHTVDSLLSCGAEVQKGNPPTERKIQRLFRNPVGTLNGSLDLPRFGPTMTSLSARPADISLTMRGKCT